MFRLEARDLPERAEPQVFLALGGRDERLLEVKLLFQKRGAYDVAVVADAETMQLESRHFFFLLVAERLDPHHARARAGRAERIRGERHADLLEGFEAGALSCGRHAQERVLDLSQRRERLEG